MCCIGKIHHIHTWISIKSIQIPKAYKGQGNMYAKVIDYTSNKYFVLRWGRRGAWQKDQREKSMFVHVFHFSTKLIDEV